jgi:4-amino-4-deoxy-L-arabinose transferase-like glycosyltransferase
MSVIRHDPADRAEPKSPHLIARLIDAGERFVAGKAEGTIVLSALVAFAVLWMLYDTASLATADAHPDVSEATDWAHEFAFGYKHPPMTAWLYILWFTVFPHKDWAAHLMTVTVIAAGLGITWRLLRDHLDKNRALFGLAALFVIPLYNVKAEILNANTVMVPFWSAALLFYLRARRGLSLFDAFFAGAFASLAVLGKYWALFLLVGMALASVVGADTRRFWRSAAPYVMAAGAAIVLAPHLIWFAVERGGANYAFLRDNVMATDSFATALAKSGYYLFGTVAYALVPLIFLAALRPRKPALADIAWPSEADRRQAWLLFVVPLVLPAMVNLAIPYRLTPDWTLPNWALLPVVLYASRFLSVDENAVVRAGLVALTATVLAVIASPFVAYERLASDREPYRAHYRQAAELAQSMAAQPVELLWGNTDVTAGMRFYLPQARLLTVNPLSAAGRAEISAHGLAVVCLREDAACRQTAAAVAREGSRTASATFSRSFLGFSGQPMSFSVTVVPPNAPVSNGTGRS